MIRVKLSYYEHTMTGPSVLKKSEMLGMTSNEMDGINDFNNDLGSLKTQIEDRIFWKNAIYMVGGTNDNSLEHAARVNVCPAPC